MEALDNPSYFSLPSNELRKVPVRRHSLSRRWLDGEKKNHTIPFSSATRIRETLAKNFSHFRRSTRVLNQTSYKHEDADWFISGRPRPEDIAPSLYNEQYQHHHHQQRRDSPDDVNNAYNLMDQDMVHCKSGENDLLFNTGNNTQYYNTAATMPAPTNQISSSLDGLRSRRRHSLDELYSMNRDKMFLNDSEQDTKNINPSFRNKFKQCAKIGTKKSVINTLDVLLVSCEENEAATSWVNYLISCFQQISREHSNPPLKLQNIQLDDTLIPSVTATNISKQYTNARLQIIIICPLFLKKLKAANCTKDSDLAKMLQPDKTVAMMLGVQDSVENQLKSVFPGYDQWRKMSVKDQDTRFVGDFLGVCMDILSRTWQLQEKVCPEKELVKFSLFPKKVQVGQRKLLILFTEPLTAEDILIINAWSGSQRIEITDAKLRNPYAIQFTMPVCCFQVTMLISVNIKKNGKSLGHRMVKCESKMRELEQLLTSLNNPVQVLCQSFGLSSNNKDHVDLLLLQNFRKNIPAHFNLLTSTMPLSKDHSSCNEEYPTLLHFCAKYGLERLTWQLVECPGGHEACQIQNCFNLTPADMAEKANHSKLANALRGYMQMTELSSVYNYLKGLSKKEGKVAESNYILPKPLSDTYLIPPTARPLDLCSEDRTNFIVEELASPSFPCYSNFQSSSFSFLNAISPTSSTSSAFFSSGLDNYDVPMNGQPFMSRTRTSSTEYNLEPYLDMNPNSSGNADGTIRLSQMSDCDTSIGLPSYPVNGIVSNFSETSSTASNFPMSGGAKQFSSKEKLSPDDELLEIINDFKNNVFSISEVEMLVQNWQNRNDVRQSFREKEEQLTKMREEYDRIQRKLKDQIKRTTPFERIRKFFGRNKPKGITECEKFAGEKTNSNSALIVSQSRLGKSSNLRGPLFNAGESTGSNGISSVGTQFSNFQSSIKLETCSKKSNIQLKNNQHSQLSNTFRADTSLSAAEFSPKYAATLTTRQIVNDDLRSNVGSALNDVVVGETEQVNIVCPRSWQTTAKKVATYHHFETNSLRLKSKSKLEQSAQNKVRSAENLLPTGNVGFSDNENKRPKSHNEVRLGGRNPVYEFCSSVNNSNDEDNAATSSLDYDRKTNDYHHSRRSSSSSSLNLSLLSLNSNNIVGAATSDKDDHENRNLCTNETIQCDDEDESRSFELNVVEKNGVETEIEALPPLLQTVSTPCQRTVLIVRSRPTGSQPLWSDMPEYVNLMNSSKPVINSEPIGSSVVLKERCEYTAVVSP